ncbi:MAG: hypothetical protein KDA27_08420 [Candidatus Eisenbacteria bacterium]|uniref:Uncharacterized protein n=1 Tax=Eiseniibacteriota bacterium TaxID=2212470 RepID=A0A956SE02_UNCEI|nr:hypothetical protein [Candidatus Eisenbacteria bacterium]MCB9466318.1 hypothetical protein [Candidatus Eisenbacteria bacterium]
MRALRDHTSQRRSLLGGSRIWLALAAVLGVVLIASGAVRILAGARARSLLEVEVANLASDRADLEDTVLSGSVLDEAEESGGVELAIPYGGVPGPILEDLLAILESLEIRNYEYKIRERSQTVDAPDPRGRGATQDDSESHDAGGESEEDDEVWASDEWGEQEYSDDPESQREDLLGVLEGSVEFTPGLVLYHWTLDLVLRTEFRRVVEFLDSLAEAERMWRVSEVGLARAAGSLHAHLLLETFTRPLPGGEALCDSGTDASNDPFQATSGSADVPSVLEAPTLRAVVTGSTPRAWIGEKIVEAGGSAAQWTVEEIDENGVWIRHSNGRRVRLHVGG